VVGDATVVVVVVSVDEGEVAVLLSSHADSARATATSKAVTLSGRRMSVPDVSSVVIAG
jgi:hypothetical protein